MTVGPPVRVPPRAAPYRPDSDSDSDSSAEGTVWDLPAPLVTPSLHTLFARRVTVRVTLPRTANVRGVEVATVQEEMPP